MKPAPPASAGYLDSLRSLGDGLLASVQDRLKLFALEMQEEKYRLIQIFIWISAIAIMGLLALTFASLTLVYLCWDGGRLAVLGGLAAFYTGALVVLGVSFQRFMTRQPKSFTATQQEIEADRACIRSEN